MAKMTSTAPGGPAFSIRTATPNDAVALLAIYAPYVEETTITFEDQIPSVEEFRRRIEATLERYPYLVAETGGANGESGRNGEAGTGTGNGVIGGKTILGYAYAGAYKARVAYDWSVEATVYVSRDHAGEGVGSALYSEVDCALEQQNVVNVAACITAENEGSVAFHQRCGYETVAKFPHIGFKFGRWLDVLWMQKTLGAVPDVPQPFIPFGEL